jgi:hypothetical protein
MVGRHGEGDEANRRAPHGSDVRERRHLYRSAQSRREYGFQQFTPTWLGPSGPSGDPMACGHSRPTREGLGRMGRILKKIPFSIKYIFEYTKDLEICTRRFRRNFDMRIFSKFF